MSITLLGRPVTHLSQRLAHVDLHRYDEAWERNPAVLFSHFYSAPKSLAQSLGLLSDLVLRPGCCILDFRTAADFMPCHLPGSVNVPLRSLDALTPRPFAEPSVLEAQWLELEELFSCSNGGAIIDGLRDRHVLAVCYTGDTARVASSVLRAKGVVADSLGEGWQAVRDYVPGPGDATVGMADLTNPTSVPVAVNQAVDS